MFIGVFGCSKTPEYRAGFLNRVSQVRILPRAPAPFSLVFIDFLTLIVVKDP